MEEQQTVIIITQPNERDLNETVFSCVERADLRLVRHHWGDEVVELDEVAFVLLVADDLELLSETICRFPRVPCVVLTRAGENLGHEVLDKGAGEVWFLPMSADLLVARLKNMARHMGRFQNLERENRRISEINDRMKRYVGHVAHDLRGPLGKLINTSEILLAGVEAESLDDFYRIMARTSRRGFDLVNNILDITALESGRLRIDKDRCNMNEIADQVVTELNYLASEKEISLRNRILKPNPVVADAPRIAQVIANLVTNAIKFTPRFGMVTLQAKPSNDTMRIEVTDTGIGMSEEQVRGLFDKVTEKVVTRGTEGERGTGLGLAISQEIVKAHGSSLSVRSRRDEGSTFSFKLPVWQETAS